MRIMAIAAAPLLALTGAIYMSNTAAAQPDPQLVATVNACNQGDVYSCEVVAQIARSVCNQGNSNGCAVWLKVTNMIAQINARNNYSKRADVTPRYDGNNYEAYPGDPLAGNRGIINDTNSYIRSKCSNPNLAAQLRAFGYCR